MQHMDNLLALLERKGHLEYAGEGVSQIEHAWQCGQLALQAGASNALCLAAWLHDVGHLMHELQGSPTLNGVNDTHEQAAAECLEAVWGPSVAQPVRLHVLAKRYLVTKYSEYHARLSEDSRRSLVLQGGLMTSDECLEFESSPFAMDALRLRAWDDAAKRPHWFAESTPSALKELEELMRSVPQSTLP